MIAICHLQDGLASFDIRRKGFEGMIHYKLYSHGCGQMEYRVAALSKFIHQRIIKDRPDNKLESGIALKMFHVLYLPGRKVIEDGNFVPLAYQFVRQVGTDETGPSGDQVIHEFISFCSTPL